MRSGSRLRVAGAAVITTLLLSGCAAEPDAEATRESLVDVTAEAIAPEADEKYDAQEHPAPVVEALECSPLLVVTVRGTGEPRKKQLLGPVARGIAGARPERVERLDLEYPADTAVKEGATYGTRALVDTLNLQADSCPEQGFVLLGYSQGALIVGDALAAPNDRLVGKSVGEVDTDAASRVLAVVLYGDPRFVGSEPFAVGDFDPGVNGLLPRPAGSLSDYADRLRDYCVADDFICQSTLALEEAGHAAYYDNGMQHDGAAFVIGLLPPFERSDAEADAENDASNENSTAPETE